MTSVHCPGLRKGTENFRQEQKKASVSNTFWQKKKKKKSFHFSFREILHSSPRSPTPRSKKKKKTGILKVEKLLFQDIKLSHKH